MHTRLELAAVSKSFGGRAVLSQAWLQVRGREAVGLVGANGAGKTTMLRIAAGLVRPDAGVVRWCPNQPSLRYFGGEATLPPEVAAHRWAGFFGVAVAERRRVGRLSRGTRQRLGLRVALREGDADILLLDEPWEGLDPDGSAWLTATLQRWTDRGAALLISSHRLHELADVCSRFVLLENGRCQTLAVPGVTSDADDRVAAALSRRVRGA